MAIKIIWLLAGAYDFKWYECVHLFLQQLMTEGLSAKHNIHRAALPTHQQDILSIEVWEIIPEFRESERAAFTFPSSAISLMWNHKQWT